MGGDVYGVLTIICSSPIPLQSKIVISNSQQDKGIDGYETPTFTMDPQKTSRVIPLLESAALGEPLGRFTKMDSACNDVVLRWVRR